MPKMTKKRFPDQGPREWTPRVEKAFKQVEWLRALIPPEFVVHLSESEEPRKIWNSLTGHVGDEALRVQFRPRKDWCDHVWVHIDGHVTVERGIYDLLRGEVPGLEHLAGRWDGVWPPPKPAAVEKNSK